MRTVTHTCAARRVASAVLAASLSLVVGSPPAWAESLGLDPTFAGGKVVVDVGLRDYGAELAIQPDGKVLVVGSNQNQLGSDTFDLLVVRLKADGALDSAFGAMGKVVIPGMGPGTALALQADGRILVGGRQTFRLLANGQLDPSWAASEPIPLWSQTSLAVQPDGRVVIAQAVSEEVHVYRKNADGSADRGFGASLGMSARVQASFGYGRNVVTSIALTSDGRIVVAGGSYSREDTPGSSSGGLTFGLLRLTSSGEMDPSFGNGGYVVTDIPGYWGTLTDIFLQGDGRIVAAGTASKRNPDWSSPEVYSRVAAIRYRSDGTLDTTFGIGGVVLAKSPSGSFLTHNSGNSVFVDAAGRTVVSGSMAGPNVPESYHIALVRFTPAGVLDTTFNGNGWAGIDTSGFEDGASEIDILPDGRIVVTGTRFTRDRTRTIVSTDLIIARYVVGDPAGRLESLKVADSRVASVTGWVADGDAASPVSVRIQVDGVTRLTLVADKARPDAGRSDARGFAGDIPLGGGNHSVCAYAVNQGAGADLLLGCQSVLVSSDAFGSLDQVRRGPGGVLVAGWAMDPDVSGPVAVYVFVDGTFRQVLAADKLRTDVGTFFPGTGNNHGYQGVIPVAAGTHNVCALALNQGPGTTQWLGCKNVSVTFDPFGSLDVAMTFGGPAGVGVRGWAIDPDVAGPVTVYIYVDGAFLGALPANQTRVDVAAVIPGYGTEHGFEAMVPGPQSGPHDVCAFAINQAAGSHGFLGCIRG
jgi:uncharacterized delta-60 repeat protein